ncbi:teneurin-m [Trichonephila inaurata madagascariensis]|uniref:Teneurin-m n=1 Tax=Trichonephila inaurata madagascariensis TaxID=2747483 RepID=A0A8X7C260_9ARAC|nr:teneurin-m [Trichonephila inaurata madagascariensis]
MARREEFANSVRRRICNESDADCAKYVGHVITPQPVCVVVPRDISEYEELLPGNEDSRTLLPQESWNTFFSHPEASFVRLNFSVPHSSRLALLARKNAPPSITSYDIMEVIGDELRRYVRGTMKRHKEAAISIIPRFPKMDPESMVTVIFA